MEKKKRNKNKTRKTKKKKSFLQIKYLAFKSTALEKKSAHLNKDANALSKSYLVAPILQEKSKKNVSFANQLSKHNQSQQTKIKNFFFFSFFSFFCSISGNGN